MNSEISKLVDDLRSSNRPSDALIKAALELAYQVGVRDGYEQARDVWKKAA